MCDSPLIVKVKLLDPKAVLPSQANSFAAGHDLTITRITTTVPATSEGSLLFIQYTYWFGLSVEVPEGYKLVIVPRSSFTGSGLVMANSPGQVDSDFRGELRIKANYPLSKEDFLKISKGTTNRTLNRFKFLNPYNVGDRIAQCFIEKVIPFSLQQVDELGSTDRGEGGFGSTGKV